MHFVWDGEKSRSNLAKHKVSFERAALVFDDPHALSLRDEFGCEERGRILGLVNGVVILLVVHTVQEENNEEIIRIVSARKATRREREAYEKAH